MVEYYFTQSPRARVIDLLENVLAYDRDTSRTVRLIPTEGIMSPLQKIMYSSMQNERYLHAPPESHEKAIRYPDIARLQNTYDICRALLRRRFSAKYVIPDFLSGMHAMSIALIAFSDVGDLVMCINPAHGGHEATAKNLSKLRRRVSFLAFDVETHSVDIGALDRALKPTLIYLDQSNILRPTLTQDIKAAYPQSILVSDISQVMAMVASGHMPNPLLNGCDLVIGSTHKSLKGHRRPWR